jgi:predicted Zn finger-like uncharacterized protein
MFTQCPQCDTVFRIYAEQLAQARGQVRCGICEHSFNALENLSENLDSFAAPAPAPAPIETAEPVEQMAHVEHDAPPPHAESMEPEPSFEAEQVAAAPERHVIADEDTTATPPLTPLEPEKGAGFTAPWENTAIVPHTTQGDVAVPAIHAIADEATTAPPPSEAEASQDTAAPFSSQAERDLPDLGIIAAEPRRISATETPGGWLKTSVWAALNITLIVALLGQYTYFNRNDLSQYPELRPWLTRFCALLSCNTPLRRDVSQISLANRIVQSHPSQPNALLIDATLINEADFPQPYPLLEIRFSDLNNQLVAGRRFRPGEYLPANTSIQAGMPPHQPVHVTLEVVDPGKEAVSFQFELL